MSKDHHPNDEGLGGIAAKSEARMLRTQARAEAVKGRVETVADAIIAEFQRQGHGIMQFDMHAVALAAIRAMGATE